MSKIAIDIDNTICNTSEFFGKLAEQYDKEILHKNSFINFDKVVPRSDEWTKEELSYYIENIFNKESINIPIKKDAYIYINKLNDIGFEIVFITNRGIKEDDYTDLIVSDYLYRNNIPYNEIITKSNDKYKYLDNCDFFVDDAIHNCEQALDYSNSKVILMVTNKTKDYNNDKIFKASNWKEIYDYIVSNKGVDKMNLIKDEYFRFKHFENSINKSAIIKCLENEMHIELYKKWIAKEYNTNIDDNKVVARLNLILELKERLDKVESKKNKQQIINYLSRLLSAKFSGSKQSDTMILLTLEKLIYSFENKQPIIFIFGFGGYKNYNSPSFPEVDFSELFHMKYMTEFLWPIITTYEYGVTFEYESEEISIQFNNVPQESTDRYTRSFRNLLEYFINKVELVNNVKLDYKLIMARDLYNPNDLYTKMKEYYPAMLEEFNKLSSAEKEVWLKRARTNYLIKGTEDFTTISKEALDNKILVARINNECFLAADYDLRVDFWERPNAISLFGTWGKTPCASPTDGGLHLKSTKASNTDFWIGTGIFKLDNDNNTLQELILSHNQYEEVKNEIKYLESNNEELKLVSNNFNLFPYIK